MRLCSFSVHCCFGDITRTGVELSDGVILDINHAYASMLAERDNHPAAQALADALVPADMLALITNREFALKAIAEAIAYLGNRVKQDPCCSHKGVQLTFRRESVTLLAPIPKPLSLRDPVGFLDHIRNAMAPKPIPQVYTDLAAIYYKGNISSVIGTDCDVQWPPFGDNLDFELEIALVIGRQGRDIPQDEAMDHVFGYTIFNDISARAQQYKEMEGMLGPAKGKDFDTGNVMGPVLVTADAFNPYDDHLMLARVNGEEWSRGNINSMDHGFAAIISYISRHETLYPGDMIGSGTVPGGCGAELNKFPQPGDVIELEVDGIGILRNRLVKQP